MVLGDLKKLVEELNRRLQDDEFDGESSIRTTGEVPMISKKLWLKVVALCKAASIEDFMLNDLVSIPRPIPWTFNATHSEQNRKQRRAIDEWCVRLEHLQNERNLDMTPLEKNYSKWCHMWRALKSAHIVLQVVDARNPLFHRCVDVENFIKELSSNKVNLLLLNKADLLTKSQRCFWNKYLTDKEINHAFFSAISVKQNEGNWELDWDPLYDPIKMGKILTRKALLEHIRNLFSKQNPAKSCNSRIQVAIIGDPNVGKRSVVNALQSTGNSICTDFNPFHMRRVNDGMSLCLPSDLLLPHFSSKAESIINGIARNCPEQDLDHLAAAFVVICRRIPIKKLAQKYSTHSFRKSEKNAEGYLINSTDFCTSLLASQGIMGVINFIEDYRSGRLVYATPPPNISQNEFKVKDVKQRLHAPLSRQLNLNTWDKPMWDDEPDQLPQNKLQESQVEKDTNKKEEKETTTQAQQINSLVIESCGPPSKHESSRHDYEEQLKLSYAERYQIWLQKKCK